MKRPRFLQVEDARQHLAEVEALPDVSAVVVTLPDGMACAIPALNDHLRGVYGCQRAWAQVDDETGHVLVTFRTSDTTHHHDVLSLNFGVWGFLCGVREGLRR